MLVVADSSALVALASCNGLAWLDLRFEKICVPSAVFEECTITGKPKADELKAYLSGKIIELSPEHILVTPSGLGLGELQAMSLYQQLQADVLLIDDRRARKVAHLNQLKTVGSLSLVLWAKQQGHLDSVRSSAHKLM